MRIFDYDIQKIGELIGVPPKDWVGSCHAVSLKALGCEKLFSPTCGARVVRGHYMGYIARNSVFGDERDLPVPHSWIHYKHTYVDFTRFAFLAVPPYVHVTNDASEEYHIGDMVRERPLPEAAARDTVISLHGEAAIQAGYLLKQKPAGAQHKKVLALTHEQVAYLGNYPLADFDSDEQARIIFRALAEAKFGAYIPIDHRAYILNGGYNADGSYESEKGK
jgi:hypothetical protein